MSNFKENEPKYFFAARSKFWHWNLAFEKKVWPPLLYINVSQQASLDPLLGRRHLLLVAKTGNIVVFFYYMNGSPNFVLFCILVTNSWMLRRTAALHRTHCIVIFDIVPDALACISREIKNRFWRWCVFNMLVSFCSISVLYVYRYWSSSVYVGLGFA